MVDHSNLNAEKEARLRAQIAKAALKEERKTVAAAKVGALSDKNLDKALSELLNIALGKARNGRRIKVQPRTRARAASSFVSAFIQIAKAAEYDPTLRDALRNAGNGPTNIVFNIGVPELRRAEPPPKAAEIQVVSTPALPPVPPASPESNGHANGEAKTS